MITILQTTFSKSIFMNRNILISTKIILKVVPKFPINNNPALFQIMAWRRTGHATLLHPFVLGIGGGGWWMMVEVGQIPICASRHQTPSGLSDFVHRCSIKNIWSVIKMITAPIKLNALRIIRFCYMKDNFRCGNLNFASTGKLIVCKRNVASHKN